ncbi:hypothetical protein Vretimale_16639 [Volvox reticuliferus]|uniref:UDENN domain-containing protein n=1 Tax=Volvox reticuliferus TaxID=1737510 RepID=A0A8J4GTD4_9CHLO|nr:hypothetical protein Vretifemale_17474 [Volvox reticuliferus]GIM13548.1 hypothetical protein Vretimale_16639 [Volvox reticuliferus]
MTSIPPSHQWIVGICSIIFDIDVGQRIEHLVPEGCLSKEEQHDIAFHSFPDSMSMELHARTSIKDSTFFFRVRRRGKLPNGTLAGPPVALVGGESGNGTDGPAASSPGAIAHAHAGSGNAKDGEEQTNSNGGQERDNEERFLYGFVFCRQRQDASLRRGGEQISVVVLAEHPLSSVLQPLAAVAGHQYFGSPGKGALQQVYDEVCRWPCPVAGPQLQLPVALTPLTARLPAWNTLPHPSTLTAPEQYGNNTPPFLRSTSSRTALLPAGPSLGGSSCRRMLSQTDDGSSQVLVGVPGIRTSSGMSGVLSTASSAASGLLSPSASVPSLPPLGSPAATATVLAASPFLSPSGGVQAAQIAVAPAQQHLERTGSSGGGANPVGLAGQRVSSSAEVSISPTGIAPASSGGGGGGGANSAGKLSLSGTTSTSVRGEVPATGSLKQISGLLAEGGCAPAAVPIYPVVAMVGPGGGPAPTHQRSRSSVQVPSRSSSYAGALDEGALTPSNSTGGGRTTQGQHEFAEDQGGVRAGASQIHRRTPSASQIAPVDGAAIHGAFHEVDVYTPLSAHLPRLWQLWEMTLLGRALLLIAPTPGETSAGVAALLSLVAPLPYAADFRPYYCIHDTAFSLMASGVLPGPEARDVPTLLGVTNLYFIRALPHWPNVLSIGKREGAVAAVQPSGSLAASISRANAAVQALRQRTQGASVLMSGHTEALWSTYKPLCRPDQALLQKLILPKPGDVKSRVARIAFVNSDVIRRHFAELTTAFLAPFLRYFEPDPTNDGRVPGWNSEEFLFGLRSGGVPLPQPLLDRVGSPSAAVELYARFTSCLNFAAWFAARRRHVAHLIAPSWPRQRGTSKEGGHGSANGRDDSGSGSAGTVRGKGTAVMAEGGEEDEEGGIASWFSSAAQVCYFGRKALISLVSKRSTDLMVHTYRNNPHIASGRKFDSF